MALAVATPTPELTPRLDLDAVELEELILAVNDRAEWADPDTRARLARGRRVLERELVATLTA